MADAEVVAKTPWWRRGSTIGCAACAFPFIAYLGLNFAFFLPAKFRMDEQNRQRGATLAATIERYRAANGRYPEALAAVDGSGANLHLVERDGSDDSDTFTYSLKDSGAAFTLQFREAPAMSMDDNAALYEWSSRTGSWEHLLP